MPTLPIHADPTYLAFSNPFVRPWHQLALELVVFACFALTIRHALLGFRRGERHHAFEWMVILLYGVFMELIAFEFIRNYVHAQFTIELYHRELPLYVTCIYVVFHYTGLKVVERLRLSFVAEALLVGFAICMLDVPFDIVGVDARWWTWSTTDPNVHALWLGVPVTSYYWYMLFGAVFASLCRALRGRIERPVVMLAVAPPIALAIIALGTLAFVPFHILKARGVTDGTIVAVHMALCAGLALRTPRVAAPLDPSLRVIVLAHYGLQSVVLLSRWPSQAALKVAAVLAAISASLVLTQIAHPRLLARAPAPA